MPPAPQARGYCKIEKHYLDFEMHYFAEKFQVVLFSDEVMLFRGKHYLLLPERPAADLKTRGGPA